MKKVDTKLKLPDDFLGTVAVLLNTPPPPKGKKAAKRKPAKKGAKKR